MDDAELGRRLEPSHEHGRIADGQTRGRRSACEIFTIPADKGDVRNLTNSSASAERDPAWSPDGKFVLLQRQIRRVQTRDRIAGRTHAAARDHDRETDSLLHALVVARFEEALFTDTNLKVWVLDLATEKAKIVGQDPWMVPQRTLNPTWSPDSKWVAYAGRLRSLYHAIT